MPRWNNKQTAINRSQARDIERHIKRLNNAYRHGERQYR